MIMDLTTLLSNAQAITATAASTNVLDLGLPGTPYGGVQLKRDMGKGTRVPFRTTVVETFNNLTSLTISIETDDNAAFSSATTVWTSPAYPLSDLATGARFLMPDELPIGANEEFLRLKYTVVGTAPTTGKITAGVTFGNQTNAS